MSSGIVFQVETKRVLQILAREIYDSPLALIRENVQNAYDAVKKIHFQGAFYRSDIGDKALKQDSSSSRLAEKT